MNPSRPISRALLRHSWRISYSPLPHAHSRAQAQTCTCRLIRSPPSAPASRRTLAYNSYPLPTGSATSDAPTTPPRTEKDGVQPGLKGEGLPRVHETRPPAGVKAGGAEAPTTSTTTTEAQAQPQQPTPQPTFQTPSPTTVTKPSSAPRRSKLRTPRKAAIHLTPSAVSRLRSLLDGPEPKLIRVGVRNRGCSGLAYHLEYVDGGGKFDETVEQDGVKVLIDSKALFSIIGSEMDWAEDALSQRFVFKNPNIKEECGCGESFMVQ